MAAAEARIVWQRTANRLQEDAKRAPKLSACCQSSSAKQQADVGPAGPDHLPAGPTKTPSYSNSSRDTKWWLNTHPDYGYRKGFTYEQLNALESEDGNVKSGGGVLTSRMRESLKRKGDVSDLWRVDGVSSLENDCSSFPRKKSGSSKSEPWWRTADRDELVSLVTRRTLDHFENCDLPPPQKMCRGRRTSFSRKIQTPASFGNSQEKTGPDESSRYESSKDMKGEWRSKARLMEALCHSQMRAREAEKAAERAHAEREHIVTLFFRQASLLFAYRHWFRLLQLETLCLRVKNGRGDSSALFPLPFDRDRKPMKGDSLHKKSDRERSSHDMSATYAVAFTLGLSLVGAGLLLGWTVAWMFPRF